MIRAIIYAKKIIERQVKKNDYEMISEDFSKYQKGFYWTNENIDHCLGMVNLKEKNNALAVASTGDHAFNLIANGINDVDTFDINRLTEYLVLGLKRTMITVYNYYEFLAMQNFISDPAVSLEQLTDIIMSLTYHMDTKYRIFWREIADYNYKIQKKYGTNLNLIHMLYINVFALSCHLNNNTYLYDEYFYEDFRNKLGKANINFKGADALDLAKVFKGKKYDIIMLSNILDYANTRWGNGWGINELEAYIKSLEGISNEDAVIFIKYILSYINSRVVKKHIFHDSSIVSDEITDKIYSVPKHSSSREIDGIILRRVKIDK